MFNSFLDMLNCPSMAVGFKKYDIFSICREIPNGANTICVE